MRQITQTELKEIHGGTPLTRETYSHLGGEVGAILGEIVAFPFAVISCALCCDCPCVANDLFHGIENLGIISGKIIGVSIGAVADILTQEY